nr:hypothetical protein Iba_chr11eCG9800 [Ipomoea batatas]
MRLCGQRRQLESEVGGRRWVLGGGQAVATGECEGAAAAGVAVAVGDNHETATLRTASATGVRSGRAAMGARRRTGGGDWRVRGARMAAADCAETRSADGGCGLCEFA